MSCLDRHVRRGLVTVANALIAAGRKDTAGRPLPEIREFARYGGQMPHASGLSCRVAFKQASGIWMARRVKHLSRRSALHDFACVHHDDIVTKLGDDAEMMRYEEHLAGDVLLQLPQELDGRHFERGIQRGRRFVSDQERGLHHQGHGNCDPLLHPA